jgi:hypothetical protein
MRRLMSVCYWQIVLQKSLLADERNFSGPLVRPTRGDVRDRIVSSKTTMDLRIGPTELCSGRDD